MSRRKIHQSGAAKQRAYRERKSRDKRNGIALRMEAKAASTVSRPPVRYFGGKWRIASWIIQYFPEHTTYCEPFAGGASVLFRKPPSKFEVINDLNGDVVNFFDVLRSDPEQLIRAIQLTPFSREEHRRAHDRAGDSIELARRFYVRSRQSFGSGEGEYNTGWRFQKNDRRGSSCIDEWNSVENLWAAAERLKQVQIECDDALATIARFDSPDTLFYVDPPYVFESRYSNEHRYAHELTNVQHVQLADVLKQVQGKVILSGYHTSLYESLYSGWQMVFKETKTNGNHNATEYLWLSPRAVAVDELPLFKEVQ